MPVSAYGGGDRTTENPYRISIGDDPVVFALTPGVHVWNVSYIAGEGNYTDVSDIPFICDGDTIRIWGTEGHIYEGGFTINAPNVTVKQWENSPVRPLLTNTSHTAPAITVRADNATLRGLDISGNSLFDSAGGAGILACGDDEEHRLEKFTITACRFSENTVNGKDSCGGGIYAGFVDDMVIEQSEFIRNTAYSDPESFCNGGACCFYETSGVITGTEFSNNAATGCGGCCCIIGSDHFVITNTSYTNNAADDSGGGCMFIESDGVTVANTTYTNNIADDSGGGCMFFGSDDAMVTHSTYSNNSADDSGGGCMFFGSDDATVTHSTYNNNSADDSGGGCMFFGSGDATVIHTSYINNAADDFGGGCMFDTSNNSIVTDTSYTGNDAHTSGCCCCFLASNECAVADTVVHSGSVSDFSSRNKCNGITFTNLTFQDEVDTSVSFTFGGDMQISGTVGTPPADPVGYGTIGHFVNVTAPDWMLLSIGYTDDDVAEVNASTLTLWNTTGGAWGEVRGTNGVNTVEQYVYANLTALSAWQTVAPFAPVTGNGTLQVNSTPSGARVYLNGTDTGELTNVTLADQPVGTYNVTVEKDGYAPATAIATVATGTIETVAFALVAHPGAIRVCSGPANATIWLDGENTGEFTNTTITGIASGVHTVTVEKPGYLHPTNRSVTVVPDEVINVSFTLTPVGTAPVASFTAAPLTGDAPLQVVFTDTSTGGPETWNWSFGDGTFSGEQDSVHTYEHAGVYTVTLTAANAYGMNTTEKERFVMVSHHTSSGDDDDPVPVITPTHTPVPPKATPTAEPTQVISRTSAVINPSEVIGTGRLPTGPDGTTARPVTIRAEDMSGYLTIGAGVVARDAYGMLMENICIVAVPATAIPSPGTIGLIAHSQALYAYTCTPEGVSFTPAITLTFTLSEEEWDVYGDDAQAAWFNSTSGEWEVIAGVADAGNRTIMIQITHFSTYALFADDVPEVPLPDMSGTPAGSSGGSSLWVCGLLIVALVAVGGILISRRQKK